LKLNQILKMTSIPKKVEIYEQFLNEKLRNDLKTVLNEREQFFSEIAEYMQIKNTVENIVQTAQSTNDVVELKTKVDLGCNFYLNAVVQDPSRIFIAIGYGFFLEMTLQEAVKFIDKKIKILTATTEELSNQAAIIKANIRLVLQGLKEIQNLDFKQEEPFHEP
jgi:prefoldin alpha subunit